MTLALYPETKQQNDWKKEYKLAKQKLYKSSIYSNIRLKVKLDNLFKFDKFFIDQLASNYSFRKLLLKICINTSVIG